MTRLEDRKILVRDIEQARADGARLAPACALAGIDAGTLRRWQAGDGLRQGDRRPTADHPIPSHALPVPEQGVQTGRSAVTIIPALHEAMVQSPCFGTSVSSGIVIALPEEVSAVFRAARTLPGANNLVPMRTVGNDEAVAGADGSVNRHHLLPR